MEKKIVLPDTAKLIGALQGIINLVRNGKTASEMSESLNAAEALIKEIEQKELLDLLKQIKKKVSPKQYIIELNNAGLGHYLTHADYEAAKRK